jgi:hypothetical protein
MTPLESVLRVAVALVSFAVFALGIVAYARRRTPRMLLVLGLFTVFAVQGVLLLVEVFVVDTPLTESAYYAFQLVEVALVAAVILKR